MIFSEEECTPHHPPSESNLMKQREAQEWVVRQEHIAYNMWSNK